MLAFAAHLVVPGLAFRRRRNITCPDDEVTETFAIVSLERITLDHGLKDCQDFWLGHRFCP